MNHCESIYVTNNHHPVDRPTSWLDFPVPLAFPGFLEYFNVNNTEKANIKLYMAHSNAL